MSNKYQALNEMAFKMAKAALQAGIDPKNIHIRLERGFWFGAVMDGKLSDDKTTVEAMQTENSNKFELFDISFHNERGLPDWLK
jgi:hypothetical protein